MPGSPYLPASHCGHRDAPSRLYWPGVQEVGAPAPGGQYEPAGQAFAVALVEPEGQYAPAWHAPEHAGETRAALAPKVPAEQLVHAPAPASLYLPGGQAVDVSAAEVDRGGQ